MQLTTIQQTTAFLWAFVMGAGIAVVYTVICSVRIVLPPSPIQLFISDFLFMTAVCIVNTLYAISLTEGRIRLYFVVSEIIGYIIIYALPGRLFIKLLVSAVRWITGIIKAVNKRIVSICSRIIAHFTKTGRKNIKLEKN